MHPYWFYSQRYFIENVIDKSLLSDDARYVWWADEDFFEKYKEWLWDEYHAVPGSKYTFAVDNPMVSSMLEEWIDFEDEKTAELFVLKFSVK